MRTHSEAHLPITDSSMSSEPIPIAHISEEIQIEEDPPSEEPEEIKDNDEPKVQAKSSVVPVDDLVSALKSFGGSSSKAGNIGRIREPEPFLGKDQTKLKAFLFQCRLYFQGSSDFEDRSRRVTFALSYLQDVAVRGPLHGIVLQSSYLDLILSHAPISLLILVYLCMILSLFHHVLRCSIRSFVILIAAIITGRL